ncbi:PI31 proteasome regulator N-terminal-domain-containing protein [Halenospora varia]|nr:PI31 proteasome regulator N-terminal-domain-containing protein [Halenospora varia]
MANNPLSTESILKHMAEALPTHNKEDTDSDISSSYEAIALFSHACMIAVGFRLIGFGENQKTEAECSQLAPRLSSKWNASFGSHSFLYAHSQSSMQYLVKIDRLGGKAEIRGIGLGDERISRFEITAKDYISSAALPLRITMTEAGEEDRSNLEQKLKGIFISPSRVQDLASEFKLTIIQKLMPGLHKEGYEEAANANAGTAEASRVRDERAGNDRPRHDPLADPNFLPQPARPYPFHDPLEQQPRRPIPQGDFPPPGFDDEYDLQRPLRGMAPPFPGAGSPFNIGHDDLNPPGLGPHDPLRGSFVGGGGGLGGGMGGGMHPDFNDPMFGGRGGRGQGGPNAPPGARYDPLGPGDGPRGGMGGRPPNPFGGFGSNDFI